MNLETIARNQTEWMQDELTLFREQFRRIQAINPKYTAARQKLFEQHLGDRYTLLAKLKALDEEKAADLEPVLTQNQWKVFRHKRKERRRYFYS